MSSYVVLANYTEQGLRNIKEAPASGYRIEELIETSGGKLSLVYLTMGLYDLVFVAEAPNDAVFATILLNITKAGDMHTTTLKAFSSEEMSQIINNVR
jgi:uncharacterized protein with GYD domain